MSYERVASSGRLWEGTLSEKRVVRRLAAILAADVVGYSRLMQADEVGTLEALKAHRRALVDRTIAGHRGRIVKTTGDGALVEFASVVDAVGCAVAIQRGMVSRNASVAEDKRIVFRIGINVGDIIIDGDDIFGDGVNIAARLEALCDPGGLCISRAANDQIRDKLSLAFADMGEQAGATRVLIFDHTVRRRVWVVSTGRQGRRASPSRPSTTTIRSSPARNASAI
jgi:class 3 adenylate cyclase